MGYWRGLYEQKLNLVQKIGLLVLFLFYAVLLIGLIFNAWPRGQATLWHKVIYGYGLYFLLWLPWLLLLLIGNRRARRNQDNGGRQSHTGQLGRK
jgi:hypothetical protein